MKTNKFFHLLFFFVGISSFSQQNQEFIEVKQYFDKQRYLLGSEFKKKYENASGKLEKHAVEKDFAEFMGKLDSIQNVNLTNELVRVKNREDLEKFAENLPNSDKKNIEISEKPAEFPGGINALRKYLVNLMYFGTLDQSVKSYRSEITFIVDKKGYITHVKAEGESPSFNRQAEIAMYMIPEKFSPALIYGVPARYRFRVPISLNFE